MGCTLSGHPVVQVPNGQEQQQQHTDSDSSTFLNYRMFTLHNKTDPTDIKLDKPEKDTGCHERTTTSSGDHSTFVNGTNKGSAVTATDVSLIGGSVLLEDSCCGGAHSEASSMDMINQSGSNNSLFPAIVSRSRGNAMTLSRTCRSSGSSGYVTLPAIVNREHSGSSATSSATTSPKMKDIATRIQSPHVRTIRMHLERQYSDSTSNKTVQLPPFHSTKLRKSFSCNDSWLSEINDYDGWDDDDNYGHLPAIKEVDVANDDALVQHDTKSGAMKFPYQTTPSRSCWLMSPPNTPTSSSLNIPKRHRDRSPSMDASRLPVILEDSDVGMAVNREEDIEASSSEVMNPQVGRLDVKDDDVNTTEYSVRMYVASMTELLGLDNIDPRDVPLLNNISIDPSSPLLVQYNNPPQSKGEKSLETTTINANSITKVQQQQQSLQDRSNNNNNNNDRKHTNSRKQHENAATVIKSAPSNNQSDYINVPSDGDNG